MKGRLSIIGRMNIDGEILMGAFVECSTDELRKGRELFCEDVTISLAPPQEDQP